LCRNQSGDLSKGHPKIQVEAARNARRRPMMLIAGGVSSYRNSEMTWQEPSTARLRKDHAKRTKNSRQRRLVREDLPLRTPRRGSGKSKPISEEMNLDMELPAPASATAPAKDGFGRFRVSAACGADLSCLYRASPPPSMPSLWSRPVAATPIRPSPAIRGRRA
jgi:hypothetical protein